MTGCSVLGPDFEGVEPVELPNGWNKDTETDTSWKTARWWFQFQDPALNRLVEVASEQNLDLESAGLRILQARAALGIADSFNYPQAQTFSGNLAKIYQNENTFDNATLNFDAGWELDAWGKFARGVESAEAGLYASIASYHDIMVSITAEVARNYVNYRTFQERVLLSERNIEIQERVVEITEAQLASGNVTELDVQQAKTQLYSTKSALPSLRIGMMQSRNALAVLLGSLPDEIEPMLASTQINAKIKAFDQKYDRNQVKQLFDVYERHSLIPRPPLVSTTVDASLVLRRPDLQLAELQAHAQSAQIGIAEAEFYPRFSLFGAIGINSTVPAGSEFSFSDSLTLSLGPAFSWNVFQYGRVENNVRFEDARFQETLTNYNKRVLLAVQEVSNALEAYQLNSLQKELAFSSVSASVRAFNISLTQYENGQITFERLLSSVEKMTRSEDTYAQVKGNVANQVIALYKSLGGGWEANTGKPFVREDVAEQMKARTDWENMLDDPVLPSLSPNNVETAPWVFGKPKAASTEEAEKDDGSEPSAEQGEP
ncbi:TolC family protein [Photobacterium sp. J15]|uniref:TolC family protein n=1 Tax=Photobacterium sp. J15 TaxID=265901 RepID=UPI001E2960A0|nr:TolC family protein [Photobacterium sp. J15]